MIISINIKIVVIIKVTFDDAAFFGYDMIHDVTVFVPPLMLQHLIKPNAAK